MNPGRPSLGPSLRLGVVGAGRISQVAHLPAATKADRICLVGVCDTSPEVAQEVAGRYGVRGFTDVGRLLEEDIDAKSSIAAPGPVSPPLALGRPRCRQACTGGEAAVADTVAGAEELARLWHSSED